VGEHGPPRDPLEREAAHELAGGLRGDHVHLRSQPGQVARDLHRLVRGDPAGHPQDDPLPLPGGAGGEGGSGQTAGSSRRRRFTSRNSICPEVSASSARVVSFFSSPSGSVSRGSELSSRAYFAETSTPRYLLPVAPATSSGVNT